VIVVVSRGATSAIFIVTSIDIRNSDTTNCRSECKAFRRFRLCHAKHNQGLSSHALDFIIQVFSVEMFLTRLLMKSYCLSDISPSRTHYRRDRSPGYRLCYVTEQYVPMIGYLKERVRA
jgi:hypothetical protein